MTARAETAWLRPSLLHVGHCSVTMEIDNGCPALSTLPHTIQIPGQPEFATHHNVFTLHDLDPDSDYEMLLISGAHRERLQIHTRACTHRIDVREFGAVGDGTTDNTAALQAAFSSSPPGSLLEFPAGDWLTGPLFLSSGLHIHLARHACLLGHPDMLRWPVLPPTLGGGTHAPMILGSWEGAADSMHAALLTGINVNDVSITGPGSIDANAAFDTWWSRPKEKLLGRRPRILYFADSQNLHACGITLRNSPSWNLHALRCSDVHLLDLSIAAPERSPNTDGINPESCSRVRIAGAKIEVGDDCIAIKSGKLSAANREPRACRDVVISNCILQGGHAAVALGSEMSGGIHDVDIKDCLFRATPRGLRIKTRRGRGRSGVISGVRMRNVHMSAVGTPFVINCFYNCDVDANTPYVADRNPRPIDAGTPAVLDVSIVDVVAESTRHCAAFVLGLPELPIANVTMQRYRVSMDPQAEPGYPDRAAGIESMARGGFYFCNLQQLQLHECSVTGAAGAELVLENVTELIHETSSQLRRQ